MSDKPRISAMAFERRYADNSGVEFAVRLKQDEIECSAVNDVTFPAGELDWLIACLQKIKAETAA